jgi:diazepam-binding inhibitor (GABA receptor modulating acyl-CoA-binding protein)
MSNVKAQFEKAVQIVKDLPADGPVKPSQDEQLQVSGDGSLEW